MDVVILVCFSRCLGYTWYSFIEGSHNICILFDELRNQQSCENCVSGTGICFTVDLPQDLANR